MIHGGTLYLRDATEQDIDAIAHIETVCFTDPWTRGAFKSLLGPTNTLFLVGELATEPATSEGAGARGELAGYIVAWTVADEAEIANVAVAPTLRGRGVGAMLLDTALGEVSRRGAASVYLEVRESNEAARRLYASRGFVEVGRRRNYYRRPQEDALVLRRERGSASTAHDDRASAVRSV